MIRCRQSLPADGDCCAGFASAVRMSGQANAQNAATAATPATNGPTAFECSQATSRADGAASVAIRILQTQIGVTFKITPEMRAQWLAERMEREQSELHKAQRAIELLRHERKWIEYHDGLTDEHGLSFWHGKGVPDWAIDYYQLGWCPDKVIWRDNFEYHTPTATIPVFAPGWQLVNIRHRLINPPDPGDKYRPDRAGIPAALYLADPDKLPEGECILVEGEIKTIVVACNLDNPHLSVCGLPGKTPRPDLLASLDRCDRIHILLDPDAVRQSYEIAKQLGKRARIVRMPCKPDDAFTMYDAAPRDFYAALRYGRLII